MARSKGSRDMVSVPLSPTLGSALHCDSPVVNAASLCEVERLAVSSCHRPQRFISFPERPEGERKLLFSKTQASPVSNSRWHNLGACVKHVWRGGGADSQEKIRGPLPQEEEAETGRAKNNVSARMTSPWAFPHMLLYPFSCCYNHVFYSDLIFTLFCHFLEHRENKLYHVISVSLAQCVTLK